MVSCGAMDGVIDWDTLRTPALVRQRPARSAAVDCRRADPAPAPCGGDALCLTGSVRTVAQPAGSGRARDISFKVLGFAATRPGTTVTPKAPAHSCSLSWSQAGLSLPGGGGHGQSASRLTSGTAAVRRVCEFGMRSQPPSPPPDWSVTALESILCALSLEKRCGAAARRRLMRRPRLLHASSLLIPPAPVSVWVVHGAVAGQVTEAVVVPAGASSVDRQSLISPWLVIYGQAKNRSRRR
ncbi:unnamed protein product [Lota lota]